MERKFALLYLNTGAGHRSAARALEEVLREKDPTLPVFPVNGFDQKNKWGKFVFEDIYRITCNYIPGAYPLIYDVSQYRFAQSLYVSLLLKHRTAHYLRKIIVKNHITDIVSLHFALTAALETVIGEIPWKVNLTVMVTDPFTAPHAWYYVRNTRLLVYSQRVKDEAVSCCGVKSDNVHIIPFLVDKKYRKLLPEHEIDSFKTRMRFQPGKKILLLAGGGEGLPGAIDIVRQCVHHCVPYTVVVVCGRDKARKEYLDFIKIAHPEIDLHVYGFVEFMAELINAADLVVSKAGATMIMQLLCCRKPVIINTYLHNQELGNMQYIVQNHIGWFIQQPAAIYRKIESFFSDPAATDSIQQRYTSLKIDTDAEKIADLLLAQKTSSR